MEGSLERGYAKTSSLSAELPVANKIGACQQSARPPPIPPLLELSWTTNHTRWVSRCFPTDTEVNIWSVPYQLMFSSKDSSLTTSTDEDASRARRMNHQSILWPCRTRRHGLMDVLALAHGCHGPTKCITRAQAPYPLHHALYVADKGPTATRMIWSLLHFKPGSRKPSKPYPMPAVAF